MLMFDVPLHKLVVHLPIALTIVATLYDSWAIYAKRPTMHETSYGLTLWAAAGALAAVVTGLQLAQMIRIDRAAVTGHAGFGIVSAIVITAIGVVRYSARQREKKGYPITWLVLEWAAAALICATAIMGHRLS